MSDNGNAGEIVQHGTEHRKPLQASFETDVQDVPHDPANNPTEACNQKEELLAEMNARDGELSKASEANRLDVDASLEFELVRNKDAYLKNLSIGEQISLVLNSGKIPEKSLSKQHKFCLDLFRAQQATVNFENAKLRSWQIETQDKKTKAILKSKRGKIRCGKCNLPFWSADQLEKHSETHQRRKNFHCTHCTKGFARADRLKMHERSCDKNPSNTNSNANEN